MKFLDIFLLFETFVCWMDRVNFDIRESASPRHAPIESVSRFRGAGCGVVAALMRRKYYGEFAQES